MPRRPVTVAARDRRIEAWSDALERNEYEPLLRTEDVVAARSNRFRLRGLRPPHRIHHCLSYLEAIFFSLCERDPRVKEIREQYALLPVEHTCAIARELAVRHPRIPRTRVPCVMTTDFLVTYNCGKRIAWSVKPTPALGRDSQVQKQLLEQSYWALEGVSWRLVTERELRIPRSENIFRLLPYGRLEPHLTSYLDPWLQTFHAATQRTPSGLLAAAVDRAAIATGLTYDESTLLYWHSIWTGRVEVDLTRPLILDTSATALGLRVHADA